MVEIFFFLLIIDSHVHLVQYIAGTGGGGELRSCGNGDAAYANGEIIRQMIPVQFGGNQVTAEQILEIMDRNQLLKKKSRWSFMTRRQECFLISKGSYLKRKRGNISCNRLKRMDINDDAVMKEQYLRGYVAYGTFDDISRI